MHNKPELVKYYHVALFGTVLSMWLKQIQQGNFSSLPGLTVDLVRKHFTKLINTTLVHMHQQLQNVQSTQRQ